MDIRDMNTSKHPNRIYYFDMLRVIACSAVVLVHVSGAYVVKDFGSVNFWVGNVLDSASRIAIPVFVMLSGALMLDERRAISAGELLGHIKKIACFFVFWSAMYTILNKILIPLIKKEPVRLRTVVMSFLTGNYHLWFCFMIVGLYLVTPLLRLWVKAENKRYVEYFLALSFVFNLVIPQVTAMGGLYFDVFHEFNAIVEQLHLKYTGGYVPCFILGWYLHNFECRHKKTLYALGAVSLAFTVVMTYLLSYTTNTPIQVYDSRYVNILFQGVGIFVLIKSRYGDRESGADRGAWIEFLSKNTMGIYAMHVAVTQVCFGLMKRLPLENAAATILIVFGIAFAVSLAASSVFHKIPFLNKVV